MDYFILYGGFLFLIYLIATFIKWIKNGGSNNKDDNQNEFQGKNLAFFADSAEKVIAVLGSGYLKNLLLNMGIRKGLCVVSDRRVYFKGTTYYSSQNRWKRMKKEDIVDLADISSTSTVYRSHWPLLLIVPITVAGLIWEMIDPVDSLFEDFALQLMIANIIAIFCYILTRNNLFQITFAGGQIAFNTAWYSNTELENFQKLLRQAKDHSLKSNTAQQTAPHAAANNLAEQLSEYVNLLKNGYLTQDEFNAIKKAWFAKQGIALN